ncbi:PhzF family phenazine biosynthesis protein [Methylobrevis pamukkalensis]|nr:PhzF family phenazine biosynthesis protein [Methylobrevis pamukkalensis]
MVLDVFTDRPLTGNPLAVVLDSEGLDSDAMQAIAREFNLSETVFVAPPEQPAHTAKIRIFTPTRELPFAGHPTIGSAVALAEVRFGKVDGPQDAVIVLEEGIGSVRCAVELSPDRASRAVFDVPKLPEAIPFNVPKDVIAAAIGLEPSEIGFENHLPSAYTAGVPFVFVPVRDLGVMRRVSIDNKKLLFAFAPVGIGSTYVYTRETEHMASSFHARMMSASLGTREDPATGSAAAAFAGVVVRFDGVTDGQHPLVIEQGYEMGRPSRIDLELQIEGGRLTGARIAGEAVLISEGRLTV